MAMRRALLPDMGLLQTFEAAARHGNFSRAAEELSLTQSAISRQVRDLEDQLGVTLFERIRKRVVLSDAGRELLPEVRQLLAGGERLMLGARRTGARRVQLRVASLPTFGARWLVPRLGDFTTAHPGIDLTVEARDRPFDFGAEPVDLAIHYGQPVWPGGVATFLCSERVMPVASPGLAARFGQDLTRAPLLHLTGRAGLWQEWFNRHGQQAEDPFRGLRFDHFSMIIAATEASLGVGLLPLYLIEQELAQGRLVQLAPRGMPTEQNYYIVVPEGQQANPAAAAFVEWIVGQPNGQ